MNTDSRLARALYEMPERFVYIVFALVMIIKGGYYGFLYHPVLDDFIQYHTYTLYDDPFRDIIMKMGLLSGRPLAAIFDIYFWSDFWSDMRFASLIITALFILSGILIYRIFSRHFKVTPVFLFLYGLVPLGSEAVNWLSAASRIIVPLFFLGLSLTMLQFGFDAEHRLKKAVGYVFGTVFLFASMAFYEQITIVAFILSCTLLIANKKGIAHYLTVLIPTAATAYFYLFVNKASIYAGRMNIIDLSAPPDELWRHVSATLNVIFNLLFEVNRDAAVNGLEKGLTILHRDGSVFYIILLVLAAALVFLTVYFHAAREKRLGDNISKNFLVLLLALILIFLPVLLFVMIQNPWISLRNAFPSVLGLSLLIDLVFKWLLYNKYVRGAAMALLCACFIIANVAELNDYLLVGQMDRTIAENTLSAIASEEKPVHTVVVLNTRDSYVDTAVKYHEHINNITSSDWAYKGALYAVSDSLDAPDIYPLHEGPIWKMYPEFDADKIDAYYYMDDELMLHKLTAVAYNENFSLYDGDVLYAELLRWNYKDPSIVMTNEGRPPENLSFYGGFEVKK
ncbi:MAG: glucosyltransferase domain-containing protein [Clostridia bacterium]|nr:glucosyltransferase domain-containing protein [Clostridia bacterium]